MFLVQVKPEQGVPKKNKSCRECICCLVFRPFVKWKKGFKYKEHFFTFIQIFFNFVR